MVKRIDKAILDQMAALRKAGATYEEIESKLGVSRWACIKYLKGIDTPKSAITEEWVKAELEAIEYLRARGFTQIHNLNHICSMPYWDLLAKKGNDFWLIDVTVSPTKQISGKVPYSVNGYINAILYKNINTNEWKLVRIFIEEL
jgi:hypothetical protein